MVREEAKRSPRGRRDFRLGIALAAIAALAGESQALAADPVLWRLAGQWTGRGTIQLAADGKPEKTFCKLTNTLSADGNSLQQSGRCAAASNSGPLSGTITALGGGRYVGTLQTPSTSGPTTLTGSGSGDKITFSASFVDGKTKQPGQATVILDVLGSGSYRLVSDRRAIGNTPAFIASEIVFAQN